MGGRAAIDKGKRAERAVVAWLQGYGWPDVRRYLAGDGRQPGDIDWHPLICLEVKDRVQSCWPSWCRQAAEECKVGQLPAVVRKVPGVTDPGRWEARLPLTAWCSLTGVDHGVAYQVDGEPWVAVTFHALARAVWAQDHDEPAVLVCAECGNDMATEGHYLCLDCLEAQA